MVQLLLHGRREEPPGVGVPPHPRLPALPCASPSPPSSQRGPALTWLCPPGVYLGEALRALLAPEL